MCEQDCHVGREFRQGGWGQKWREKIKRDCKKSQCT